MMQVPVGTDAAPLVCHLADNSRIKLVGLGGIGCIVLDALARFLKGRRRPARLVLIDGDRFEPANGERMAFGSLGNKAEVKAAETLSWLGPSSVTVVAVPEYLTAQNIPKLVRSGEYVVLCVDNHQARKLVSDHVSQLPDVALFSGGNDGVDPPNERGTYGNVQIHIRRDGRDVTAPLTRYHPEIANSSGSHMPTEPNCGQLSLATPQIFFTNQAVASMLVCAFFVYICGRLAYQEVKLDILEARMLPQFPLPPEEIPQPLPEPG